MKALHTSIQRLLSRLPRWAGLGVVLASLHLAACSKAEEEKAVAEEEPAASSYVAFATRAQGAAPSINTDNTDHEDRVGTVRLLAFLRATGEMKHNQLYNLAQLNNTPVAMKPGTYDFYFVANEAPTMTTALNAVRNRDDLYQTDVLTQIPYGDVATKPGANAFLMTAIVENQTVNTGHLRNNPLRLSVNLIRVLAKVTLTVRRYDKKNNREGQTEQNQDLRLKSIVVNNIPSTYSLFPPRAAYAGTMKTASQNLDLTAANYTRNAVYTASFYLPEYLRASTAQQAGNTSVTLTYSKHGIDRTRTAVIDHVATQTADTYKPANWSSLSRYSVVRNTNYGLTVNLIGWEEEAIALNWEILPWNKVTSLKDFTQIHIVNLNGEIANQEGIETNPGSNIIMMHTGSTQQLTLRFKALAPHGAVWRFMITNTLDFELTGTPGITGIVGDYEITLTVRALKPWRGTIRSTELYLTINGQEVQVVPGFIDGNVKPGPAKRYLLYQVI